MCKVFRQNEPIPVPEIAVPASAPKRCAEYGAENDATEKEETTSDLFVIDI